MSSIRRVLVALLCIGGGGALRAQSLDDVCHATSSYDLTVMPDRLRFERAQPAPNRVQLIQGRLRVDDASVPLPAESQDRLTLFERQLRALVPRVRQVAQNGVDLAVQSIREQAAGLRLSPGAQAQLEQRLRLHAAELKQRIARSNSTRDWDGAAAQQYADQIVADLMPLVAGDLGQQAIVAATSGDLQAASDLRDRAADLATNVRPLLERRLQALRPQIQALCPDIRRLAELQQGVQDANGRPLDLLQITR